MEQTPAMHSNCNRHITAFAVRDFCGGISDMTLWRWLHDEDLDFPKPIYIGRRRYWKEGEIVSWLEDRAALEIDRIAAR